MRLIITPKELEKEFKRLIEKYDNFYWATAWASSRSPLFTDLLANKLKIRKLAIGIHFYQTHPDFIEAFLNDNNVHFMQQPAGTFHPKLYLFTDNVNNWELIVGSPNFTNEAFSINTEASILLTNKDNNSTKIFANAIKLVKETFLKGKSFNAYDIDKYRATWIIQQDKLRSLSGEYGSKNGKPRPIYLGPVTNRNWEEFMSEVRKDSIHGLNRRLRVIEIAKDLFKNVKHFNEQTVDQRKFIAGIPNKLEIDGAEDWAYFGSMKGAGIFKKKIIENDTIISIALDQIPISGQITKQHYDKFIEYFTQSFTGNYIATATRLLCMKRPDTFVCFDSKNRSALCKDFGITQNKMNYERFWNDIVLRICDSDWWQNPRPQDDTEIKVSEAGAAFLDSLYYKE